MKEPLKVHMVDIRKIKPPLQQPRTHFDQDKLKKLADTYKTQGIIQPLEIDENYRIITGERRWRASKIAGLKKIPCRIIKGLTQEQKLERRLVENIHHEPLTELEKAKAIKKLMKLRGWNETLAANNLGISRATIYYLLALLEAPKEVKKLVKEKKISPTDAGEIVYRLKEKPKEIIKVAKTVARSEKSRRKLLRDKIKEIKLKERKKPIPKEKFEVIYADPPWRYDFSKDYSRSVEAHYPSMSLEELSKLRIPVGENSVLFLWATAPKLKEALQLMEAWGFTYRTNFVWVKDKIGMGYWTRNKHELLLIGVKGNPSPPSPRLRFPSVILAPRKKHSEKPEIVYEMIEKMFPKNKKIELFARKKRKGWEEWGLEL